MNIGKSEHADNKYDTGNANDQSKNIGKSEHADSKNDKITDDNLVS